MNLEKFPKTRYYGSKRRLLSWYQKILSPLQFNTALDRFGGTGSVSLLLQHMQKNVLYHDALYFNTISAKALFSPENFPDITQFENFINKIKPQRGIISKNFKQIYYSDDENQWLDGTMSALQALDDKEFKNIIYYCLFQACLKKRPFNMFHRANYYLRTAKVERKFGNITTWNKPFPTHMYEIFKNLEQYKKSKPNNLKEVKIISENVLNQAELSVDLVYFDPPYLKNTMSDDYYKRYHFLEGLSRYEEWAELIDYEAKTKRIHTPNYLKKWHQKDTFREVLYKEIKKFKNSIVVLSYASGGYPSVDSIYDYFISLFTKVVIHKKNHSHALSKEQKIELVIIGYPYEKKG
jgi:adenine-specific DNA-methyltransferase